MSTAIPQTYPDPEYEAAHRTTFSPTKNPVKNVLPPGVREEDFARALEEFSSVVGKGAVFVGEALSDYIDPYDVWEDNEEKRRVPSAAVWSVPPTAPGFVMVTFLLHAAQQPGLHR